jgi:hypothetical protein
MKNILSLLIFIACVFSTSSCKEKNANTSSTDSSASSLEEQKEGGVKTIKTIGQQSNPFIDSGDLLKMIKNMAKVYPEEIEGMKQDAEVIINHRYKEDGKKSYAILEKDLWEYEFIYLGRKMSEKNQFAGCWIDFANDMTYNYGHYQEVQGSGKYTWSLDTGLLLLIDDSNNIKPQEFKAKVFDQTLVTVGNHIYRDNNYNSRLKRIVERPKK